MKKEIDPLDATPSKRLFLSIMADYDVNRSICELIDNALDLWILEGKKNPLEVEVKLDTNQQNITVTDNAGGVKKSELRFIVGPGHTTNVPTDEIIGIFGVGTKRAVVALSQDIKIVTRYRSGRTHQVEFDDKWLEEEEDWELPVYEVDQIADGTTIIELQRLRMVINDDVESRLKNHLQATYARFISDRNVTIKIGEGDLEPITFDNWAYPPKFRPHRYFGDLSTEDEGTVQIEILAGLTTESSPAGGEYGVYFYCNDRLVGRALKDYQVGYTRGLAGLPHPSTSLARIVVSLRGPAKLMPWNSSKSGINPHHNVFTAIRDFLVQVVKDFASLSRRWEGQWPEKVFKYTSGRFVDREIDDFPEAKKSYLPPLPKSKPRYGDIVKQKNREVAREKPWTKGLYEGIVAVDVILRQKLDQKNRISLIVLDSTLEIAFKEFLVNDTPQHYSDRELLDLFRRRDKVQNEVKKFMKFRKGTWGKIDYYYRLRCKLVHERSSVSISDYDIENFRETVQYVLKKLFNLGFERD